MGFSSNFKILCSVTMHTLIPRLCVITVACGDFVALACLDAYFAKCSVPILIHRPVTQAVLVVQFIRDLFERSLHLFNSLDFAHAPAGLDCKPGDTIFLFIPKDVNDVAIITIAAWSMLNLEHVCDDIVLFQGLERIAESGLAAGIICERGDDQRLPPHLSAQKPFDRKHKGVIQAGNTQAGSIWDRRRRGSRHRKATWKWRYRWHAPGRRDDVVAA